jgi:hypothetical protein
MSSDRQKALCGVVVLLASALLTTAVNAVDFGGKFLCVDEFGGGGYFASGKWSGVHFNPSGRFVFSLRKVSERPAYEGAKEGSMLHVYTATVAEFGSTGDPDLCRGDATLGAIEIFEWEPIVRCEAVISVYWFNPERLRYLTAYPRGWITGEDNNDNTPSMMGGSCVRID